LRHNVRGNQAKPCAVKRPRAGNILVVLPSPMGDAILCAPSLRSLRRAMPHSRITLLGNRTACDVLAHNDWADEQMCGDDTAGGNGGILATASRLRRRDFDAAILLSNSFRSALLAALAGIGIRIGYDRDGRGMLLTRRVEPFRLCDRYAPISMLDYYGHLVEHAIGHLGGDLPSVETATDRRLQLFTSRQDRREADVLLNRWGLGAESRLVMLVPGGAFGASKLWPAERFAQLADRLVRDGYEIIISCAPNDAETEIVKRVISACGEPVRSLADERLSLGGLKALISRCRLVVANDTGPCHIAAAFGVPLVTLFGPTDPRWTATGYGKEVRLRADTDCPPCQRPNCSRDHRCMLGIEPDDVYDAAVHLLRGEITDAGCDSAGDWYRPFEEQFVPMRDGTGLVHAGYSKLLGRAGLGTLQEVFSFENAQRLEKPSLGRRSRLRVTLGDGGGRQQHFYIKRYAAAGPTERLKRRLFRMGGRLESGIHDFAGAMMLAETGLGVARPIAYGVERTAFGEKRSFAIIEELPRADALERLLRQVRHERHDYAMLGESNQLIRQAARLIGRMHNRGLYHRDLYLSHIFLSKGRNGQERVCLIDLQRVFRPQLFAGRWRVKDLAQLHYSGRQYFRRSQQMRFLLEYLGRSRLSRADKRLVRAVVGKAGRISRHDQKRLAKIDGQP